MTVNVPGYTTLTGRPETILRILEGTQMWDAAAGDDYIEKIKEAVERSQGIHLEAAGDTYEQRAKNLLAELAKHGLINIIDENKKED